MFRKLYLYLLKCEFNVGQTVLYEGDIGKSIYIIKEGCVKCFKREKQVRLLDPKDFFGESAVLFNINRSLSVLIVLKYNLLSSFRNFFNWMSWKWF